MHELFTILKTHCTNFVSEVIDILDLEEQPLAILEIYTSLWNGYVATLLSLNKMLTPFVKMINEIYDCIEPYDDKESYPFSVIKLGIVIWNEEVATVH